MPENSPFQVIGHLDTMKTLEAQNNSILKEDFLRDTNKLITKD